MDSRIEWVALDEAVRLGRELGIGETQASRGAFRMMAHNPEAARQLYALLRTLMTQNKLPLRLRELIVLRLAWTTATEYAWFQHYTIATAQAGLSDQDVLAVRDWKRSDRWSPADRAVLAAVDDTLGEGKISDAVWALCTQHIPDPAQLVEVVIAIGNWTMFSQILRTLEVPLQDGAMMWPPDGNGPS